MMKKTVPTSSIDAGISVSLRQTSSAASIQIAASSSDIALSCRRSLRSVLVDGAASVSVIDLSYLPDQTASSFILSTSMALPPDRRYFHIRALRQ